MNEPVLNPRLILILAEEAYTMGLQTVGEAANYRLSHYDAWWLIDDTVFERIEAFRRYVEPYWNDHTDTYLTPYYRNLLDAELARVLESPTPS